MRYLPICILPFEKEYFKNKWNWEVEYVGHPLVEVIEQFKNKDEHIPLSNKPIIAILPGSRKQEIVYKLPVMLSVSTSFPEYQFIVAQAPSMDESFYQPFLSPYPNVSCVKNNTYELLQQSKAALVTSGTATLETALFAVPEVVCYKAGNFSYQLGKRLVKIKFISLVNLIMDRLVVKELIQDKMNTKMLVEELNSLLKNEQKKQQLSKDYTELKALLSKGGNASAKAAESIYQLIIDNG